VALGLIVDREQTEAILKAGSYAAPFAVFAAGLLLSLVQRHIVSEYFFCNIMHLAHWIWDGARGRQNDPSSMTGRMRVLGVPFGRRRIAYTAIRRRFIGDEKLRELLNVVHSEIGALYFTVAMLLVGAIVSAQKSNDCAWFVIFAIAVFTMSVGIDIRQHTEEARILRAKHTDDDVRGFLKGEGFIA